MKSYKDSKDLGADRSKHITTFNFKGEGKWNSLGCPIGKDNQKYYQLAVKSTIEVYTTSKSI